MKLTNAVATSLLCLLPCVTTAQSGAPTAAQCRGMIEGMVQSMKSAPLQSEKDKQGARELIDRVEKRVRENRARGVAECTTWGEVAKMISTQ